MGVSRRRFAGMDISVEIPAGGTRTGVNSSGVEWSRKVSCAYGYILGTHSPDGEHLDCYVSKHPNPKAKVYVVHQLTPDGSKYDEDKVMLGFSSAASAKSAYKENTFKPNKMFGAMSEFDLDHFKVVAYQASKSKAILSTQGEYDKIKSKIPASVKPPVEVAKRVSETFYYVRDMYGNPAYGTPVTTDPSEAIKKLESMGPVSSLYEIASVGGNPSAGRMLSEGLRKGDLSDILVPRISVDQYVPRDKDDNVVLAFFVKNAPEAVEPLRLYCDKCSGVDVTDSGDSDTMKNTSIVYVEFKRDFEVSDLISVVEEVVALSGLSEEDLSVAFPHMSTAVPYSRDSVLAYFLSKAVGRAKSRQSV